MTLSTRFGPGLLTCCLIAAALAAPSSAQETTSAAPGIEVELNSVAEIENGCTVSFVIRNSHEMAIEQVVYETVLFDTEGSVKRLTLFDFGTLPPMRPRVRQFALSDMACSSLGTLLINGATTCEAAGASPELCSASLSVKSRVDIDLIG